MGFHKYTIGAHCNSSTGNGFNHFWVAPCNSRGLIGTLERVGDIHNHGHSDSLHDWDAAEIDHQILISKCGSAFSEHDLAISKVVDFVDGMFHGLGR